MPGCIVAILGWVLTIGCSSTSDPATGDLSLDLIHRDPRVRIEASIRAQREGRRDLAHLLIDNLDHNDINVRMVAGMALRKLTGQDLDYSPHGTPAERRLAMERWREWVAREGLPSSRAPDGTDETERDNLSTLGDSQWSN